MIYSFKGFFKRIVLLLSLLFIAFSSCKKKDSNEIDWLATYSVVVWTCHHLNLFCDIKLTIEHTAGVGGTVCKKCPGNGTYSPGIAHDSSSGDLLISSSTVTNNGRVISNCSWTSTAGNTCGYSYYDNGAVTPTCRVTTCDQYGTKGLDAEPIMNSLMGYDLLSTDPPIGVKSFAPANNTVLYSNEVIRINFEGTTQADTLIIEGNLKNSLGDKYKFSRSKDFNDTLQLNSGNYLDLGKNKSLELNLKDVNEKPISISLNYHIVSPGTSKTPNFDTCSNPCKLSWQGNIGLQFSASGGIGPYKWYAGSTLPAPFNANSGFLPPNSFMNENGYFTSSATLNFMPNAIYPFVVLVVDSIGQSYLGVATIDTTDPVAQLAACVLSGLCG